MLALLGIAVGGAPVDVVIERTSFAAAVSDVASRWTDAAAISCAKVGIAMVASTAKMTMAIMSSRRVKPRRRVLVEVGLADMVAMV
jgi:hypothetical protein